MACPSLYSTIRLAHLVQHVKNRLRSFIEKNKQDEPKRATLYLPTQRQSYHAAKEAINATPRHELTTCSRHRNGSTQVFMPDTGCTDLLRDVESRTSFGNLSLCKNAAHDSLFLRHNFRQIANAKSLSPLRRVYELTSTLLRRLKCLRRTFSEGSNEDYISFGLNFDDIVSDEFYANLEHLLRCLQQIALDAIVCLCVGLFVNDLLSWNRHQRDADEWFAEWPNAQRPLNTTWPWNVKTALLVLWVVCWMFYANGGAGAPFNGSQRESYGQNFQARQQFEPQNPPISQPPSAALVPPRALPYPSYQYPAQVGAPPERANEHHPVTAPQASQATYPTSVSAFPYINPSPYASSDLFPATTVAWPYASGSNPPSLSVDTATSTTWQTSSNLSIPLTETPATLEGFPSVEPYVARRSRPRYQQQQQQQQQLQTPPSHSTGSTLSNLGFSLPLELQTDMQNYPSPQYSDVSGPTFAAHQNIMHGSTVSPLIPVAASPSLAGSSESRQSSHKSLEPTRNTDGVLFCNHPEHGYNAPTFARKCEWSKHMDRHTRPYACEEPGCENIRGFTYSGGLHRHQREVHRQHGGPKAKCMCPHQDCKRSTGLGFSRRENLLEHLRRVHRDVPAESIGNPSRDLENLPKASESRKRKRHDEDPDIHGEKKSLLNAIAEANDDYNDEEQQSAQSLRQEVKKLRRELQESGERVKKLEHLMMEQFGRMQQERQKRG